MPLLKSCCLCFSPRTGAFILGTLGIIFGGTVLAPMIVMIEHHNYYITQFVATERDRGNNIDENLVPTMAYFSKMLFSAILALTILYIFSCILLLAGIATSRHFLVLPWLVYIASAIVVKITLVIAFMIAIANYGAVAVLVGSLPCLAVSVYCWQVVLAAYRQVQVEDTRISGDCVNGVRGTASHSSLESIKEGLHRVIGGTPPPPYEAVTVNIDGATVDDKMSVSKNEDKTTKTASENKKDQTMVDNIMPEAHKEERSCRMAQSPQSPQSSSNQSTARMNSPEVTATTSHEHLTGNDKPSSPIREDKPSSTVGHDKASPTTSLIELLYKTNDDIKNSVETRPTHLNIAASDTSKKLHLEMHSCSPSTSNTNINVHEHDVPLKPSPHGPKISKPNSEAGLHSQTKYPSQTSLHSQRSSHSAHSFHSGQPSFSQRKTPTTDLSKAISHQDLTSFPPNSLSTTKSQNCICTAESGEVITSNQKDALEINNEDEGDAISVLSDDTSSMSTTSINSNTTTNLI